MNQRNNHAETPQDRHPEATPIINERALNAFVPRLRNAVTSLTNQEQPFYGMVSLSFTIQENRIVMANLETSEKMKT